MKKLIYSALIISFLGCKDKPKDTENTIHANQPTSEVSTQTESKLTDYKNEIIPGIRLGTIILNENATTVLDSLGRPDSGDAAMGKAVSTWHEHSKKLLSIYTTTQMGVENFSRIKAVRTISARFKTAEGLGISSTLSEIEKHYKLNKAGTFLFEEEEYVLYSSDEGIGFEVGNDKKCHGVVLTEKGTSPEKLYLTFYPGLKK